MLEPYHTANFKYIQQWITDAEMLFKFSGPYFSFPITAGQIAQYQERFPERAFYYWVLDGMYCAFGEIIPQQDNVPRLGRILIGEPEKRGKGLGKIFIKKLIWESVQQFNCPSIELFVMVDNTAAIKCYEGIGFTFIDNSEVAVDHNNITYRMMKMQCRCDI